ncbi:S-adenosyl-L-methionine-dependent methyltransferases superfamily protein [Striga hermonthica]|uniref:S-adenosyl-L-methionine-dependent methyltransferases superfamily protein n=1 Tax=Striga hermonthica TaxID=68872 RepID=A0A9N7N254_STRHE|nr:S-adenosyl-L-methionine-dependent methyltransferases superfamily protein [Striga hermonthica]
MALLPSKGVVISIPTLVLTVSAAAILLFFLVTSLSSSPSTCTCPVSPYAASSYSLKTTAHISPSPDDINWVKAQIEANGLHMHENILRKGINPRTRQQQLQDLLQFKGISHYEGPEANNHTALPCPGELLVEEHHSNYGEPWAGGRDVFEFLAGSANLTPDSRVLEIGCGTLRVGLHFIRFLNPERYHCLERDELSLMAALRYELPSQGLLQKRPLIMKGEDMDFGRFGSGVMYDLIYASAVFLHMPDTLVWTGMERLAGRLRPVDGRIFVSHNIKFCSRLGGEECTRRLNGLGLEYRGKHTHDSLLFNHYEIWFEFRRFRA